MELTCKFDCERLDRIKRLNRETKIQCKKQNSREVFDDQLSIDELNNHKDEG